MVKSTQNELSFGHYLCTLSPPKISLVLKQEELKKKLWNSLCQSFLMKYASKTDYCSHT